MLFLPVEQLKVGMKLESDVYFFRSEWVAMLKHGQIVTQQLIDRIKELDNPGVYIKEPDVKYTRCAPIISTQLKKKTLSALKKAFNAHKAIPMDTVTTVANEIADTIIRNNDILVNIMDLKAYDDYTFHHSISVAVMSVAIGKQMKLRPGDLRQLALCALLHDIGKIQIPKVLINKPDKLTVDEYERVKEHCAFGLTYLKEHHINAERVCAGVVSHHERYNGEGYPAHLAGEEIPLFGRIIAVADVFDALTSQRPYRSPIAPADAAEYVMGNGNIEFDYEIIKAFMQIMEFYPRGTFVRLNTGQLAVVVARTEHPLRPVVRLADQSAATEIDLLHEGNLSITIVEVFQRAQVQNNAFAASY